MSFVTRLQIRACFHPYKKTTIKTFHARDGFELAISFDIINILVIKPYKLENSTSFSTQDFQARSHIFKSKYIMNRVLRIFTNSFRICQNRSSYAPCFCFLPFSKMVHTSTKSGQISKCLFSQKRHFH